jgi:hypothetical protein
MWVMVAGPYASGGADAARRAARLAAMSRAALALFRAGHVPVIGVNCALPLIAAAQGDAYGEVMLPLSLALAERCDAILRLPGESRGADAEVARFRARGAPVYTQVEELPPA